MKIDNRLSPEILEIVEFWEKNNEKVKENKIKLRKIYLRRIIICAVIFILTSLYFLIK